MNPRLLARRIVTICHNSSINVSTEAAAHNALADALQAAGLDVQREVRLNDRERIDLLVDGVGIEVKVQGTRRDIWRQLQRYAASEQIHALVLATSAAWPAGVASVGGKPLFHASLARGWL